MSKSKSKRALPELDEAVENLKSFFELNPYSTIERAKEGHGFEINKPWGDSSLIMEIEDGFDDIAEALNSVKLPERFSALWHKDEEWLEVIWTALHLPKAQKEIESRKFDFVHNGAKHVCEFGESSKKLMKIAKHVNPLTISETNHRNIQSFSALANSPELEGNILDKPRSFWIRNIRWDESQVVDTVSHLNFYMKYFDALTPTVVVHPTNNEPLIANRTRYIKGEFPNRIDSTILDENLLSFWSFADSGNPMLRFLLYYRILEYAAVHFINDEIREQLRKIIVSPDLKSDIGRSIGMMVGAMGPSKLSDAQRLRALVRKTVDPALIWRDLKANNDFFTKDTKFDGGFVVRAPIGKSDTEASFGLAGLERVADRFREIRNALSHGKDQETAGVIRPTPENGNKFKPWVQLIATAAGEVVLYKDAT